MSKLERDFQANLIKELKDRFDGCIVTKLDSSNVQGIPDILVLYKDKWATLECKKSAGAKKQPNQQYYVQRMNTMSFSRFIYPENKEEVLNDLGASKYHCLNYDEQKVAESYSRYLATQRGTVLHEFAAQCISLGQKLPKSKKTLNMYVNDAIGYKMIPEQILYYSENCFGTADAISFRDDFLRIHDLKSGQIPAHMEQLEIYAALFCLEYKVKPSSIGMELRLYQSDEILVHNPTPNDIYQITEKIITFDKILSKIQNEED